MKRAVAVLLVLACHRAPPIRPGEVWRDTNGDVIQAHAGCIVRAGDTFYWFGENRAAGGARVNLYTSRDLVRWTFAGGALAADQGELAPGRAVERPKVFHGASGWVMALHIDDAAYGEARWGRAVSDRLEGPYRYLGSLQPLGHQSRDMTVFEDGGAAYLVYEDRQRGVAIAQLSDDGLQPVREVALIPRPYEGLALVRRAGLYYLLGSHLTGWASNPDQYATAPSLAGPWSEFKDVAPPSTNTFDSQSAFILPLSGDRYLYLGDRWNASRLDDSRYVWMPLAVTDGSLRLAPDRPFTLEAP